MEGGWQIRDMKKNAGTGSGLPCIVMPFPNIAFAAYKH